MTQEEKELLLQDLCARLLYKVKIEITWWVVDEGTCMNTTLEPDHIDQLLNDDDTEIKPYLRSMSSMTEEERLLFYQNTLQYNEEIGYSEYTYKSIDWLNAHHFDYRGLIEKGLAIEAPKGMYKN